MRQAPAGGAGASTRFFYGWVVALAALVILMISNGLTISGITVFDESLLREFGWDRGALKFRDLLQFLVAAMLGPAAGAIADRHGVKKLMLFGAALLAVCFVWYSRIGSIAEMYAIHVLFGVALASCGLIVNIMLVSHWFVARRGTAIGIALVGTSLGGVMLPQLGARLIVAQDGQWREAIFLLAALPVLLAFVILALVRESPGDMGQQPLGASGGAGATSVAVSGMAYADAIRTWTFWALAFAAMTTFYCILGAQAHLVLHLRGLGFSPIDAAKGLSQMYLFGLIGKFLFGYLSDHLDKKRVFIANMLIMLAGAVLLATMSQELLLPFLILFGAGWGGLYTLLQLLTVESFGLRATGKILGTITVLDAIGGGLGPWITGVLYQRTGSYQSAFVLIAVLVAIATVVAATIRVKPRQP